MPPVPLASSPRTVCFDVTCVSTVNDDIGNAQHTNGVAVWGCLGGARHYCRANNPWQRAAITRLLEAFPSLYEPYSLAERVRLLPGPSAQMKVKPLRKMLAPRQELG